MAMLLGRSILLQVGLLVAAVLHAGCQDYGSEYAVDENSDGDGQHYETDHPDYSKYYSVDTSAPLVTQGSAAQANDGFLGPIEYAGFFGPTPLEFGASQKQEVAKVQNPFVPANLQNEFPEFYSASTYPKDYFEESQRKQQLKQQQEQQQEAEYRPETSYDIPAGPSYISAHVPATAKFKNVDSSESAEVESIDDEPIAKYKDNRNKGSNKNKKEYDYEESSGSSSPYKSLDYSSDFPGGKSSSTVSQSPSKATPYQKYSFQPVSEATQFNYEPKYLSSLISTAAPFNPSYAKVASTVPTPLFETQASEDVPSHLKGKNCHKIQKQVDANKEELMNCYVCEDPKDSSKVTQCSYAVEPDPTSIYAGNSERYSTPGKGPDGFRYKRYSGDEYNLDPYEFVKKQSRNAYQEEPQETKDEYAANYEYVPNYSEAPDKSYSEIQSEQVKLNAENCVKEDKDGMTCTVCKDPKTGGNFEQCSYTSAPKEEKFAYVAEKKYDSNDEPEEGSESKSAPKTETGASLDAKKAKLKNIAEEIHGYPSNSRRPKQDYEKRKKEDYRAQIRKSPFSAEESRRFQQQSENRKRPVKLIEDDPYQIPQHFAESTAREQKAGVRGLEPSLYGSADDSSEDSNADSHSNLEEEGDGESEDPDKVSPYKDIGEYHFKLFPEFKNEESQQSEVLASKKSDDPSDTSRKDVEEVLAEFTKKDRSACKKAAKNGMTCYLCVDAKGIQHEECMFVSESRPQASHVAYHEVKHLTAPEKPAPTAAVAASSTDPKRKRFFKKASTPLPYTLAPAASEEHDTRVKYTKPPTKTKSRKRVIKSSKRSSRDPESASSNDDGRLEEDENEPKPKTPAEFAVGDEEGAYSAETKPVYSKTLGVRLPKYMLEKSEFEKEFDEFSGQ